MIFAAHKYEYFVNKLTILPDIMRFHFIICHHRLCLAENSKFCYLWALITLILIAIGSKHGLALQQAANYVNID